MALIALSITLAWTAVATAQSGAKPPTPGEVTCPPDVQGSPPTVGGANPPTLSERLADSKGVICPPAGVDPDIRVPPPGGGEIKVIPPPGAPGGDPSVQPK